MKPFKFLTLPIATIGIICGTTNAFATWLELVPTLPGETANTPGAISPDGKFVVGNSGANGFLYQVGSGAANATLVLSSDNAVASMANGVGYRTEGGQSQLIISGMSSGYVTEWMAPVATWRLSPH